MVQINLDNSATDPGTDGVRMVLHQWWKEEKPKLAVPKPKVRKTKPGEEEEEKGWSKTKRAQSLAKDISKVRFKEEESPDSKKGGVRATSRKETRKDRFIKWMQTINETNKELAQQGKKNLFSVNTYFCRGELETVQEVIKKNGWAESF